MLSQPEENYLRMQREMAQTASKTFRQLNDADLKFGKVTNEKGVELDLTNASFSSFLISPDRDVRKTAFKQYYSQLNFPREYFGFDTSRQYSWGRVLRTKLCECSKEFAFC